MLYNVFCECWNKGCISKEMSNAKIMTLYKNIDGKRDCNNYEGISLFNVAGKVF